MVTITTTPLTRANLPSDAEAEKLIHMVAAAHPSLVLAEGDDELSFRHQFSRAVRWLAYARRQPEPNETYYFTYWLDACREFLREHGYEGSVTLKPLVAAIVASGVTYTPLTRFPHDLSFGLALGDANQPSAAWRDEMLAILRVVTLCRMVILHSLMMPMLISCRRRRPPCEYRFRPA